MQTQKIPSWFLSIAFIAVLVIIIKLNNHKVDKTEMVFPENPPQRIVSLAPNITEILFELGLVDRIAAVSSDSDYPPQASEKTKVGSFWSPNTEAIIACKPDLVITEWFEQQDIVAKSLKRLNYKVLTLRLTNLDELSAAIEQIGKATFTQQQAQYLNDTIQSKLSRIKLKYSTAEKPSVLWVVEQEPLRVAGTNTFVSELITIAGGKNTIGQTVQQYPQISTEELLRCGAEVIIQSSMLKDVTEQQQKAAEKFWSRYSDLPAVKNNRIYVVESDNLLRLGPRITDGVEKIGKLIHPELK